MASMPLHPPPMHPPPMHPPPLPLQSRTKPGLASTVPVLIVDDNAAKRLALRSVLSPLGYRIVEADSGQAALRCLLAEDFAVILLDVCMPIMDGFETAALIRQRSQSEMTPIIFITAYADDEMPPRDRYAQGAVDFMNAPVAPDELRAKVSVFANLLIRAEELASQARDVQTAADQLRLLTQAAPIGIFHTDPQNRYLYTNPRWSEITGISAEAAVGRNWSGILGLRDGEHPDSDAGEGANSPIEMCQRFELAPPGAAVRTVLVTSKSIAGADGGITGWVGTLADVTAEAGAEAAMADARDKATEASRLKSDFLANMSHEIRTPMNGVLGMTDLLLETELDARQRDYAQTVRNSGEALLVIINDVLDFARVEAGKLAVESVEFDLHTIVDDVLNLLGPSATGKGIELTALVDSSVPTQVTGDPGRVRQVLTNLIGNAIKFTSTGGVIVRGTRPDPAAALIRFEITDTGDGIAPEKLAAVFQPFVQADTSTSRKYGGTGLGLAISSQLVALMGGERGVSSRLGHGSTFWFTISVHDGPVHNGAVPDGPTAPRVGRVGVPESSVGPLGAPTPDAAPGGGRLLLAEDNPINQKVALAMLAGSGYRVDTVRNGSAAVAAVAAEHYDAVLMDCQMPELNGYQATAAIRAQEGPHRHIPIIAITAGARQEDRERCLAGGMDGYLSKPVSKDALLAVVARSLRAGAQSRCAAPPPPTGATGQIGQI
jgi:PAS domain S-box-containing protein